MRGGVRVGAKEKSRGEAGGMSWWRWDESYWCKGGNRRRGGGVRGNRHMANRGASVTPPRTEICTLAWGRSNSPWRNAADLANYIFNGLFVLELAIRCERVPDPRWRMRLTGTCAGVARLRNMRTATSKIACTQMTCLGGRGRRACNCIHTKLCRRWATSDHYEPVRSAKLGHSLISVVLRTLRR